jgi:hypothetical protein
VEPEVDVDAGDAEQAEERPDQERKLLDHRGSSYQAPRSDQSVEDEAV